MKDYLVREATVCERLQVRPRDVGAVREDGEISTAGSHAPE